MLFKILKAKDGLNEGDYINIQPWQYKWGYYLDKGVIALPQQQQPVKQTKKIKKKVAK